MVEMKPQRTQRQEKSELCLPDDPPPLGVKNVKIRENPEKNQGTPGGTLGTL